MAFMMGYHASIGERQKCDMAILIDMMVAIQDLMERQWQDAKQANNLDMKRKVAEIGVFFLAGYCRSLQDFEIPKIVLSELKSQIQLM